MENYFNDYTIIEDEIYTAFKDSIKCPLCLNIFVDPVMCINCQNIYCKKCIEDWIKKNKQCPSRCINPNYQKSLVKSELLSKIKYKCNECGKKLNYDSVKNHKDVCCGDIIKSYDIIEKPMPPSGDNKNNFSRLSIDELSILKKTRNPIKKITSKKLLFF